MPGHDKGAAQRAKLFQNGRSQAVRLPKEFRFEGEEVSIRREGEAVILEPIQAGSWPRGYWQRLGESKVDYEVEPLRPALQDVDPDEP
jgi:antitoxin VapB